MQTGGYTTANYVWDLLQSRKINPSLPAVEAYYEGLKVISFLLLLHMKFNIVKSLKMVV